MKPSNQILTLEKLKELNGCPQGIDWFKNQKETELAKILYSLIEDKKESWANWLIVRFMTLTQKRQYAIYAAKSVLHIFEQKYPEDNRPRKAIEAAEKVLAEDSEEKKKTAAARAAYAADAAAYASAADAAARAAYAAARAAYAAAYASAAYAADAAARAAYAAAYASAADARKQITLKILAYGLELFKKQEEKCAK